MMIGYPQLTAVTIVVVILGTTTEASSFHRPTLLLDVDNTLYQEKMLGARGIEAQIIRNIHKFCDERFHMSAGVADELHAHYGSTIEGLRQELPSDQDPTLMHDFYQQVYQNIQVKGLLDSEDESHTFSTGYTHSQQRRHWSDLLTSLDSYRHLCSNSPLPHVAKIIQSLGLAQVPWDGIWTPDRQTNHFPTKQTPQRFFATDDEKESLLNNRNCVLIDDSERILKTFREEAGVPGYRVGPGDHSLEEALARAMGWIDPNYTFSQIQYLHSKNVVDFQSLDRSTWSRLGQEVARTNDSTLVVVDVGSGLLSMLDLILHGHQDLKPLMFEKSVEYYAYEPNRHLELECVKKLERMGFHLRETIHWQPNKEGSYNPEYIFERTEDSSRVVTIYLRFWDYRSNQDRPQPTPHLIVGCCFADLMDPEDLTRTLLGRFLSSNSGPATTLIYFPITFRGITQLEPSSPFEDTVPSDTLAFQLYAKALSQKMGHNMDPDKLVTSMQAHGATLLERGTSDWVIDESQHRFLWETMLYFFGCVAAPELQIHGWDARSWIARATAERPVIRACNQDLLLRIPRLGNWKFPESPIVQSDEFPGMYEEICFTAPRQIMTKEILMEPLGDNQVRIQSVCSLVSSGTELKIYKGEFDDAALDVNIDGMAEERMKYPLAYGYSLVGRIVDCGQNVEKSLLGRTVFSFAPHASQVVAEKTAIQLVPDGIDPIDAIFMPSVETALSLVHDANPRIGEHIAIFGQGLIGLLVTAVLKMQFGDDGRVSRITTFDAIPTRLAASSSMGSHEALFPTRSGTRTGEFDCCIEVSGNGRALQSALDSTRQGGRCVIGSWYGNTPVELKLGINFHRSHKEIITSQVSTLPAHLTATWTKERRFALTWELVRALRPSRLLTRRTTLHHASDAYASLEKGSEIAIAFDYPRSGQ